MERPGPKDNFLRRNRFKIAVASVGAVSLASAATAVEKRETFDPLVSSVNSANHLMLVNHHKVYEQALDNLKAKAAHAQVIQAGQKVESRIHNESGKQKIKTINDDFSDIASIDPDFGGMFYDSDGNLNIYTTNTQKDNATVKNAITKTFGPDKTSKGQIKFKQANYRFSDLRIWQEEALSLFETQGVISSGIDHTTNSLKIEVDDLEIEVAIRSQLDALGIPNSAVHIEKGEPVSTETTLRQKLRPVEGGLNLTETNSLCTLGFNAQRSGIEGFVTASHCSATRSTVENTLYYQTTNSFADKIGIETVDPPFTTGGICPITKQCRYADANFSTYNVGISVNRGFIEKTQSLNSPQLANNTNIVGSFQITDIAYALVGSKVNKEGRSSGWTDGTVTAVCADVAVSGTPIIMLCQNEASYQSAGGDSGSPIFEIPTLGVDNATLVGIHWGGMSPSGLYTDEGYELTSTGVFSPYSAIVSELGPLTVTVPTATETPTVTATATATATSTPTETATLQPSVLGGVDTDSNLISSKQVKQSEKNKHKNAPLAIGIIAALAGTAIYTKKLLNSK